MKIKFFLPMVKSTYKDIGFNKKKSFILKIIYPHLPGYTLQYISGLVILKLGYNEKISCPP